MRAYLSLLPLLLVSSVYAEQISFEDLIKKADRDYEVQALTRIRYKMPGAQWASHFHKINITIDGDKALVHLKTQLKAGNKELKLTYPTTELIKKEKGKLETLKELYTYKRELSEAQRKLRIFVNSDYKLNHKSKLEDLIKAFGKPLKKTGHTSIVYETYHYEKYDVLINVDLIKDIVIK